MFIKALYSTIIDSLFPASPAEQEVLSYAPEEAFKELPPAPSFTGHTVPLPEARSIFAYRDERVKQLVWRVKYKKDPRAIAIGGYALWATMTTSKERGSEGRFGASEGEREPAARPAGRDGVSRGPLSLPVVIIPMPITQKRRNERGFNQCELLVDEIKARDTDNRFIIEKGLLLRIQHASRQTLKDRSERLESAKGIFAVNDEVTQKFKDSRVVVIDDVITTGSTMREAIDALKKAGFENVSGLSLAH